MQAFSRRSWSEWFPETEEEHRDRVKRSLKMTGPERLVEGLRLFDKECELRKQAIRAQHPDMTDEEVDEAFAAQSDAQRVIDEEGIYFEFYGPWPENAPRA